MFRLFRHRLTFAFTLLALLSQLVFANATLAYPKGYTDTPSPLHPHSEIVSDINSEDDSKINCQNTCQHNHCTTNQTSHCHGQQICQADCDNCQLIKYTDTLLTLTLWSLKQTSDKSIPTPEPHFHSIFSEQNYRPPIM